jgi:hypothetical protein
MMDTTELMALLGLPSSIVWHESHVFQGFCTPFCPDEHNQQRQVVGQEAIPMANCKRADFAEECANRLCYDLHLLQDWGAFRKGSTARTAQFLGCPISLFNNGGMPDMPSASEVGLPSFSSNWGRATTDDWITSYPSSTVRPVQSRKVATGASLLRPDLQGARGDKSTNDFGLGLALPPYSVSGQHST